jgi:FAD/FMN-containing dehydrogenase
MKLLPHTLAWRSPQQFRTDLRCPPVTGLCSCVSVIGPLLGGGHSFLQGHYGFAADNLVSARLVLANGSVVEASGTSNPDLFWAIRGAGHNFGIVTSFDLMVHDIPKEGTWTLISFLFTQERLEEMFDAVNKMDGPNGDHDVRLAIIGSFARIPNVDAANVSHFLTKSHYSGRLTRHASPSYRIRSFSRAPNRPRRSMRLHSVR